MNERFYKLMSSHYREVDPKIYYLAELLFAWYIQKEYFWELLSRRGFSIDLWRNTADDHNLDIIEALVLDNAFERAILEVWTYNWGYDKSNWVSWHVEVNSEIMHSPEYDEIYTKIWNKDWSKAFYYKIDFNNAVELIQKYNKVWAQDQNDKTWKYFKSSVQIGKVVQELYRQYELYWTRSFLLKNIDFPKVELANTLLFIFFELWIIEIDFDYQFLREDRDKLPDDYKIKVVKDIRNSNLYSKILEWRYSFNISLIVFIDKIDTLENLANKRLLKEEKLNELENQLMNHDFSYINDEIFQTELEILKSRKKPTVLRWRIIPWQPTIQCLWDIWLILKEWKRILSEYQMRHENILSTTDTHIEHEQLSHVSTNEVATNIEPFKINNIWDVYLNDKIITSYKLNSQAYKFVKLFIDNYWKPLNIESIRQETLWKDTKWKDKIINKTNSEWFHGYFNKKNIKELKSYIHNIGIETYTLKNQKIETGNRQET